MSDRSACAELVLDGDILGEQGRQWLRRECAYCLPCALL